MDIGPTPPAGFRMQDPVADQPSVLFFPEDLTQSRLQQIANEIGEPLEKLTGPGTADVLRITDFERGVYTRVRGKPEGDPTGDLRSNWQHSLKLVELRDGRAALLPNRLRTVE